MFQRLKRMWTLSKKDEQALKTLESLTPEQLAEVPDATDDKAVFFGEGTQDEFKDQQREDSGMKGWYDRIKNL